MRTYDIPVTRRPDGVAHWKMLHYKDVLALIRRCYALIARAEQRGYERGLAEGRRREQQIHREMYYADYWATPAQPAPRKGNT